MYDFRELIAALFPKEHGFMQRRQMAAVVDWISVIELEIIGSIVQFTRCKRL